MEKESKCGSECVEEVTKLVLPCIRWLGFRDMLIDHGGPAWYFSDMLPLYLCQTITDTTDSKHGSSFDRPASPEYASGLGCACRGCWARMNTYIVSSRGIKADYTSSCPPSLVLDIDHYTSRLTQSDLDTLIEKYNIPLDHHPRLPPSDAVMSELPNDVIVMGIYDFLCLLEWEGLKVHEEPHNHEKTTLERFAFYRTPPTPVGSSISEPTMDELTVIVPNAKVLIKAESSKKPKDSTSRAILS
uniref:Uncharacterized protein n=1 Tax=Tanacetum cinerariifolium TaxID=118510 RepID=A0A6L2M7M5_TANCI|nr:hypothetical protein [Tanacetum cinerariifolium]